jgi:hypothetical protein
MNSENPICSEQGKHPGTMVCSDRSCFMTAPTEECRAALGQPRREELVEFLAKRRLLRGLSFEDLRVDLSPTKIRETR